MLDSYQSIIVLNGQMPHSSLREKLNWDVPIIAADGAVLQLMDVGITPTYIVGDGDSFGSMAPPTTTVIYVEDQNTTDFEKCMAFVQSKHLLPCLILGVNGGEIDHVIGNMQMLVRHAQGQNFFFLDTYSKGSKIGVKLGLPLSEKTLTLSLQPGSPISFLVFHETLLQTEGLEWELGEQTLALDGLLSLRNRAREKTVSFTLKQGKALVVVEI